MATNWVRKPAKGWLDRVAKTLTEFGLDLDDAVKNADQLYESIKRRSPPPVDAVDHRGMMHPEVYAEILQMCIWMLSTKARGAVRQGEALEAAASSLKLGQMLALLHRIDGEIEGGLSSKTVSEVRRLANQSNARKPRGKAKNVSPSQVAAFKNTHYRLTGSDRGWAKACAAKFDIPVRTVHLRFSQYRAAQ